MSKEKSEIQIDIYNKDTETLPKIFRYQAKKYGRSKTFMRHKDYGIWNSYSWEQCFEKTENVFMGLLKLGLKEGDVVGIIGDNDPNWFCAQYATQAAKAIPTGLYVDYHYEEVKYVLQFSKAKFVFAKDQEMVDKVLKVKKHLPSLKRIIYWDPRGLWFYDDSILISYESLEQLGTDFKEKNPHQFDRSIGKTEPDDIACVMLSSGTTRMTEDGVPRSQLAMMTHRSILLNILGIFKYDPWFQNDKWVSYLSPAWGEQYFGVTATLLAGCEICFPEKPETVERDIREIGPQALIFTARLWESKLSEVITRMNDAHPLNRWLYQKALRVGQALNEYELSRSNPSRVLKILYKIFDLLVFRGLRDNMGLKYIRHAYNAGSILGPDAYRLFKAIGLPLKQFYGSTEVGLNTVHPDDEIDYETVGKILNLDYVRISKDGEIQIRGPLLGKTYLGDENAWNSNFTADGWFKTGDAGHINENGHLVFYDRLNDLRRLRTGVSFSPQYIESLIKFSTFIIDCLVLGSEDKDFASVIVIIDYENVGDWSEKHSISYTTFTDLSQKREVCQLINDELNQVNEKLPEDVRIKKFVNLHKEFDPDDAELTRSGKIRRKHMEEKYNNLIQAIYSNEEMYSVEALVKYHDGRSETIKTNIRIHEL